MRKSDCNDQGRLKRGVQHLHDRRGRPSRETPLGMKQQRCPYSIYFSGELDSFAHVQRTMSHVEAGDRGFLLGFYGSRFLKKNRLELKQSESYIRSTVAGGS